MAFESDKVMFEIYRDPLHAGRYRVVYFTELTDHNREVEFNRALRGEHVFDGYLRNQLKEEAKQVIDGLLRRLNDGERLQAADLRSALSSFMA